MKAVFGKSIFILLAGAALLNACSRTEEAHTSLDEVKGDWVLSDLMQVNGQDGAPRLAADLETMNYSLVRLYGDGTFNTSGMAKGNWDKQGNNIIFNPGTGQRLAVRVTQANDKNMILEQTYDPAGNKAGGTIYYQFTKK
ncbi:hypothetical protein [Chitinophaga sp. 212800010-3]|uniref:hypothetical protein n=1 Tax=unclassified Chitinophaga TaxID=2619133 RepID=UPI002DE37A93|nr:hypothetical protein [Chitinophaga sp. 212800010-3]